MTAWRGSRGPALNQAQALAMRPVIDGYLDRGAGQINGGYLASAYPKLTVNTFCDAGVIEIRPDGQQWRVGMMVNCGEFARRGNSLLEGTSGYPGIGEVMILSVHRGRYQVLSLKVGPPVLGPGMGGPELLIRRYRRSPQRQPAHRTRSNPPGLAGIRLPGRHSPSPGLTPHPPATGTLLSRCLCSARLAR